MKKRILLVALMAAMLVCLFAISASAARVEDYDAEYTLQTTESFTHYEKWYYNDNKSYVRKRYDHNNVALTFVDENGQPLTSVPMWEYDEEDGKYYSLVWYISAYEYTTEDGIYKDDNVGTQTYKIYKAAKYTLSKVRAVDLRYYTHMHGTKQSGIPGWTEERKLVSLEGIYLTNGTPDDTSDDIKLQDAVGLGRDNDNYGYIGWEGQFAATGDKIVVANFRDCTFERDMEGNYGTANTWSSAYHLQCLWYPDTMKYIVGGINSVREIDLGDGVEIIACQILRDNKSVKEIVIPNSVLYLNNEAFRGTDLTKLTIGEGLISHGNDPFLYTGGADIVILSKNLLNSTYTGRANALIANTSATVYFDGNKEQAEALMAKIIAENNGYNNKITLIDYSETQDRGDVKNVVIFYNYNTCEAFYRNEHKDDSNPCTVNCDRCGYKGYEENPVHNYATVIVYTNYLANGTKTQTCQNPGCAHNTTPNVTSVDPIVSSFKGFSTKEVGNGLTFGYTLNLEAIKEYEAVNSTTLEFGFVVAVPAFLGDNAPLDKDGNAASNNVIKASIASDKYTYTGADFRLTSASWDGAANINGVETALKDIKFYMAGYIIDGTSVIYINDGATGNSADAYSYRDIAGTEVIPEETPAE